MSDIPDDDAFGEILPATATNLPSAAGEYITESLRPSAVEFRSGDSLDDKDE